MMGTGSTDTVAQRPSARPTLPDHQSTASGKSSPRPSSIFHPAPAGLREQVSAEHGEPKAAYAHPWLTPLTAHPAHPDWDLADSPEKERELFPVPLEQDPGAGWGDPARG